MNEETTQQNDVVSASDVRVEVDINSFPEDPQEALVCDSCQ